MQVSVKQKIADIQQANRDKSLAKIAELTAQHDKEGRNIKKNKNKSAEDENMFNDLDDDNEEQKSSGDLKKQNHKRDKKDFVNKGKVDDEKQANKRKAKEAKKQAKLNK